MINVRGEMLFVKHEDSIAADPNEPGRLAYWVPPGGGLNEGETFEEAAVREIFEETGLRVSGKAQQIYTLEKPLRYGTELRLMHAQYYLFPYDGECEVAPCDAGENITDVRWWTLEDFGMSPEVFVPEGILDIFRSVLKSPKTRQRPTSKWLSAGSIISFPRRRTIKLLRLGN